jgi:hypothetical protein
VYCTERSSSYTGTDQNGNRYDLLDIFMLEVGPKRALKRWKQARSTGTVVIDLVQLDGMNHPIWVFSAEQDDEGDAYKTDQLFSSGDEVRTGRGRVGR